MGPRVACLFLRHALTANFATDCVFLFRTGKCTQCHFSNNKLCRLRLGVRDRIEVRVCV